MKLPPLTDQELTPFLEEGVWVAKLATLSRDGTMRITPLTYAIDDGDIIFSTWQDSDAVRNTRHDGTASVLIDKAEQPYAGVHYTGHASPTGFSSAWESVNVRSFASARPRTSPGTS